jgi:tellurite resistance protein TerC
MWVAFNLFVLAMLAVDLLVFHRRTHEVHIREALVWSAVWIALALAFGALTWHYAGAKVSLEYLTAYLIEKSLSVDNIFVFLLIFNYFAVPARYQHKVLFWGIIGALVMRAALIFAGITLIERYHWIVYLFGVFLVYSGYKMLRSKNVKLQPDRNPIYRFITRRFRVTPGLRGDHFFVRESGRLFATPLVLVLAVVETTDLVFALDSIPAVLAVSNDPFVVYTSNVFAILGLRALYFAVAGLMDLFHLLHYGLSFILAFVGVKMIVSQWWHPPVGLTLSVVGLTLLVSVVASLMYPTTQDTIPEPVDPIEHREEPAA